MFFIDRIGSFIKPVAAYTILRVDIFIIVPQLEQTTESFGYTLGHYPYWRQSKGYQRSNWPEWKKNKQNCIFDFEKHILALLCSSFHCFGDRIRCFCHSKTIFHDCNICCDTAWIV